MTDSDNLRTNWDELERLVALWHSKRVDGGLPARRDFDPQTLKWLLGWISIVDVIDGGRDYIFRLYGSRVAEALGFDLTGKSISDYPHGRADVLRESYERVTRTGEIDRIAWATLSNTGKPTVVWERIVLPLADDGVTVNKLMVCAIRHVFTDNVQDYVALVAERGVPLVAVDQTDVRLW